MSDHTFMPDSIGLRELAEYASGVRHSGDDPNYFVISADPHQPGNYHITHHHHPPAPKPGHIVVPADTPTVAPSRPKVTSVIVTYEDPDGTEQVMLLDGTRYDALFWSEGAVEKFLFPYYASKYQWAAAEWVGKMSTSWYGFIPTLTGAPAERAADETTPLAMAHYPRSDYGVVEDGGVGPGTDVHVLTAGEPKPVPLARHRR